MRHERTLARKKPRSLEGLVELRLAADEPFVTPLVQVARQPFGTGLAAEPLGS